MLQTQGAAMAVTQRRGLGSGVTALLAVVVAVAALRLAREVLIPFALALLLSFLLAPLVSRLRRWRMPRVPAVLLVVLLALSVLAVLGGLMASQMADLAGKLPSYQENIRNKVSSLNPGRNGMISDFARNIQELRQTLTPPSAPTNTPAGTPSNATKPVPVEIHESQFSPMQGLRLVLGSVVEVLVTALVVTVFVIFMLVEQEDLRERLFRLVGSKRVGRTTEVVDDASRHVSRYLFMQLLVNVGYGIPIALGLYLIGVPNPLLWGLITALLRYVPYAGTWISAVMPFALAMAVDPGWTKPALVAILFLIVEIVVANFVEPWVYGASGGITPLAVLAGAVFWTWVWGPVGLLIATPLTVCLVSMGRFIPRFEFLTILLGDEPSGHDSAKGNHH